jgi:AraC-like DNA-binding protein
MARHSPAPALDRAAGHGQTCGAAGLGAAYVGEDWVLVVDGVADYARSEAIAPFLLLAQPGMRLTVHTPLGLLTDTTVTRHRAGSLSNVPAPAPGAAFLYFDPLSPAGRALQAAGAAVAGCAEPTGLPWSAAWFDRLLRAEAQPDEVRDWLQALVQVLGLFDPLRARPVDRRVRSVARRLAADVDGRLQLAGLAAEVHWSPEHLRKAFSQAAGVSLSRYQMWCRITRLLGWGGVGMTLRAAMPGDSTRLLQAAGLYDAPHGSRVIRRYLGVSMAQITRDRRPVRPCMAPAGELSHPQAESGPGLANDRSCAPATWNAVSAPAGRRRR